MADNEFYDDSEVTVTLNLTDGTDVECRVVTVYTVGDKDYIALLPMNGPYKDSGEVFIYRYTDNGTDEPELEYIDDDDEYEAASDGFDEYLDSAEFDELITEEDPN